MFSLSSVTAWFIFKHSECECAYLTTHRITLRIYMLKKTLQIPASKQHYERCGNKKILMKITDEKLNLLTMKHILESIPRGSAVMPSS